MDFECCAGLSIDYKRLHDLFAHPSAIHTSLLPWPIVNRPHLVFCGKCGSPNPADNPYCRNCGHRLEEDVVTFKEIHDLPFDDPSRPIAPIEGIDLQRFPLVDPETGEPSPLTDDLLRVPRKNPPRPTTPRGKIIFWSVGIHMLVIPFCVMFASLALSLILPQPEEGQAQPQISQLLEIQERFERGDLTQEQASQEARRLIPFSDSEMLLASLAIMISLAAGFFLSGLLCGKLWHPQQLLDVGFGVMMLGMLIALVAPMTLLIWLIGVPLSLIGAALGRRMK